MAVVRVKRGHRLLVLLREQGPGRAGLLLAQLAHREEVLQQVAALGTAFQPAWIGLPIMVDDTPAPLGLTHTELLSEVPLRARPNFFLGSCASPHLRCRLTNASSSTIVAAELESVLDTPRVTARDPIHWRGSLLPGASADLDLDVEVPTGLDSASLGLRSVRFADGRNWPSGP